MRPREQQALYNPVGPEILLRLSRDRLLQHNTVAHTHTHTLVRTHTHTCTHTNTESERESSKHIICKHTVESTHIHTFRHSVRVWRHTEHLSHTHTHMHKHTHTHKDWKLGWDVLFISVLSANHSSVLLHNSPGCRPE